MLLKCEVLMLLCLKLLVGQNKQFEEVTIFTFIIIEVITYELLLGQTCE